MCKSGSFDVLDGLRRHTGAGCVTLSGSMGSGDVFTRNTLVGNGGSVGYMCGVNATMTLNHCIGQASEYGQHNKYGVYGQSYSRVYRIRVQSACPGTLHIKQYMISKYCGSGTKA